MASLTTVLDVYVLSLSMKWATIVTVFGGRGNTTTENPTLDSPGLGLQDLFSCLISCHLFRVLVLVFLN